MAVVDRKANRSLKICLPTMSCLDIFSDRESLSSGFVLLSRKRYMIFQRYFIGRHVDGDTRSISKMNQTPFPQKVSCFGCFLSWAFTSTQVLHEMLGWRSFTLCHLKFLRRQLPMRRFKHKFRVSLESSNAIVSWVYPRQSRGQNCEKVKLVLTYELIRIFYRILNWHWY